MEKTREEVRLWFDRAVSQPAGNRKAFLEANCADETVRMEVLSLLAFDREDACETPELVLPDETIRLALDQAFGPPSAPNAPAGRVGPFELGRLLGSGGMGIVYEAHRGDGEVRQRVAVKFAQVPHTATDEVRGSAYRRFLRERQMLASLRHPYIAGLIDAGTTDDGIPYAVIEQVDGVPIDVFCDSHHLDQNQRIRLVLKLCEAVQSAHRNLIVHSDIKPDNVLVTADGMPKLIDFGIAADLSEEAAVTKFRAFTPGYASPEQSIGMDPTVATDVYGIAAVLYRLLAGTALREVKSTPFTQVIRVIAQQEVVKPSVVKPELKGDLENILLKALQLDPQRRYGSVPEFADDLNRYLAQRPVRATPDSGFYIARRFVRRNWPQLAAATTLVAVLAGATLFAIKQREEALLRAVETRRLADRLLFDVYDEIGGLVGGTKAREKLGAIALQYLENLGRDYRRDPELAWELVNAHARLAQSRGGNTSSIGDTDSALRSAEKALALGSIVELSELDAGRLEQLFTVYAKLVTVFEDANRQAQRREAVERMLRLAPKLHPLREAEAHKEMARYFDFQMNPQGSEDSYARALGILRGLAANHPKPPGTDSELESALVSYGRSQASSGNYSGAVSSLREAIGIAETTNASEPHIARNARHLYWSHIILGDVLGLPIRFNLGHTEEAIKNYRIARSIAERLLRADPDNDAAKLDLARVLAREGVTLTSSEPARSLEVLQRAYQLSLATSQGNFTAQVTRFEYLTSIVAALVELGQLDRARQHLDEATSALEQIHKNGGHANERGLFRARAALLDASGQPREALAETQRHLALLPRGTNKLVSQNFETVDVLERIRALSAGLDESACVSATVRLIGIWNDLRAANPGSAFVLDQVERTRRLDRRYCVITSKTSGGMRRLGKARH
jgi:tetratricopeptide (TPR) repeat protein